MATPSSYGDQVGLGEVEPVEFVDLERSHQQSVVDGLDAPESNCGAHELGDAPALDLVERLQHVYALGDDEVGEQQRPRASERRVLLVGVAGRPLSRRAAGGVSAAAFLSPPGCSPARVLYLDWNSYGQCPAEGRAVPQ